MTQADNWSDYWQNSGPSGEVFVNREGKKNPQLTDFWRNQCDSLQAGARIVDLAAGAGSVLSHLGEGTFELHATDLSPDAARLHAQRLPIAAVTVSSALCLPYASSSFDLVTSQFGIEYAGIEAFPEAARLVRVAGRMVMLCHYRDGFIDRRNKDLLGGANAARQSDFVDRAMALTRAAFGTSRKTFDAARARFAPAERELAETLTQFKSGVHAHLYRGFQQLFERRQAYDESDIVTWLEAIDREIDTNLERLTAMRSAALSEREMNLVAGRLRGHGFEASVAPFSLSNADAPIAWALSAVRSAT